MGPAVYITITDGFWYINITVMRGLAKTQEWIFLGVTVVVWLGYLRCSILLDIGLSSSLIWICYPNGCCLPCRLSTRAAGSGICRDPSCMLSNVCLSCLLGLLPRRQGRKQQRTPTPLLISQLLGTHQPKCIPLCLRGLMLYFMVT